MGFPIVFEIPEQILAMVNIVHLSLTLFIRLYGIKALKTEI
jgi:hypothetical protein